MSHILNGQIFLFIYLLKTHISLSVPCNLAPQGLVDNTQGGPASLGESSWGCRLWWTTNPAVGRNGHCLRLPGALCGKTAVQACVDF